MISDKTLDLFKRAAKDIPAYARLLRDNKIDPNTITSVQDISKVPVTSKKTYLTQHKIEDLVWPEVANKALLLCSTSGSTGEPYYFPRDDELSNQYSIALENFLKYSSYGTGRSLILIGFGMGVWIGGVITMRAFEIAGDRAGLPISILPTGYNKTEIFKALRKLSPEYEQTVIVGYPPFVKELVDEAPAEGIDLAKLKVRFLFAAEAFTERFRNYLCEKAGIGDPLRDTLNIYGTADIGAMAYETPLSILVRRLVIEDPLLQRDVFGQIEKLPTLAQYNPKFIEFEEVNGELLLSGDAALPLIRYAVGDHGGVFTYEEIKQTLHRYKVNLDLEIQKAGIQKAINKQQPFVHVYERVDLSVTLHGINIYPEFIKDSLIHSHMASNFTERFTMSTKNDINHNQFLQINLELQKGVEPSKTLEKLAVKTIQAGLVERSSEFAEISKSRITDKLLHVILWPNGHPRYFAPGTKQKWVEKA